MPLSVTRRRDLNGALTISGTLWLLDGRRLRIRQRATTDDMELAQDEARALEARILTQHYQRQVPAEVTSGIRTRLEAIALLAEGGPANLPQIAQLADEALRLCPEPLK